MSRLHEGSSEDLEPLWQGHMERLWSTGMNIQLADLVLIHKIFIIHHHRTSYNSHEIRMTQEKESTREKEIRRAAMFL